MATDEKQSEALRQGFKYLNKFMLLMWRMGLGKMINSWPDKIGQMMVIVHTGRKSGLTRHTPLNYAAADSDVYCITGFGAKSHWYRNIMAKSDIEIWMPDGWYAGVAEDVTDREDSLSIIREVMISSGFATPLFEGIQPRTISDEELAEVTADYRLIRIQRGEALSGKGGPGELSWLWWPIGLVLLLRLLRR